VSCYLISGSQDPWWSAKYDFTESVQVLKIIVLVGIDNESVTGQHAAERQRKNKEIVQTRYINLHAPQLFDEM
jgi:hypothetical protein